MTRRNGLLVVACCLCAFACKKQRAGEPAPRDPEPTVGDSMFIVAKPQVTREPLPARFTAPLPGSVRELEAGAYPPTPFIRSALAAGTVQMRARFIDAITRAGASGAIPERLAGWYESLFSYSVDASTCKWLVTSAQGTLPKPAMRVIWSSLARCRDATLAPVFSRDDVPDDVIVDWYFNVDSEAPYSERVTRAATAVARTSDNDFRLRQLGFVFARMRGPESIAAITALQKTIADPHRRALVGLGMLRSSTPSGRAIGESSCKHPKVASDPMCKSDDPTLANKPRTDLDGMIEDGEEAAALLAKFPRADVVTALTRCTNTGRDYRRMQCFEQLAALDPPVAREVAKGFVADPDARLGQMARSLLRFPTPAAVEKELLRLGFKLDKPRKPEPELGERPPLTVEDMLIARGRSHWFDAETGMFPNEHDELLATLAALAAPTLDGAVFAEIPPSEADMDTGTYQLSAYLDGKRYALAAENRGDWYDVEAVIGLINALLVARNSDLRLAVLPTGDQTVNVIAGPAEGIRALVAARLISVGNAGESERVGKEFEDRVFEELRDGGHEVLRGVPIKK
jgi:hypothetical protein